MGLAPRRLCRLGASLAVLGQLLCPAWAQTDTSSASFAAVQTASALYTALQNPNTSYVEVQENVFLNSSNWPESVTLPQELTIAGMDGRPERPILDFGNLNSAMTVQVQGALTFQHLIIQGLRTQRDIPDNDPAVTAPHTPESLAWPSLIIGASATVNHLETALMYQLPHDGYTCKKFTEGLWRMVEEGADHPVKADLADDNTTLVFNGYFTFVQPVNTAYSQVGNSDLVQINSTWTCIDPLPGSNPPAADAAAQQAASEGGSDSHAAEIAGGVLGGVGFVALVALLALTCRPSRRLLLRSWLDTNKRGLLMDSSNVSPNDSQSKESLHTDGMPLQRYLNQKFGRPEDAGHAQQEVKFDWRILPHRLKIATLPNGKDHLLGCGAFGAVYLAVLDGAQPVAVKMIRDRKDGRPQLGSQLRAFEGELAIMRNARHRNIVMCYGGFLDPDHAYLVEEHCAGGDLYTALEATAKPPSHRRIDWYHGGRSIAIDVAHGLAYLHDNHILHLDIKSSNILLAADGTAKIADAGLAYVMCNQNHLSTSDMRGTYDWVSPECILSRQCSTRSDIWSLGLVIWEICTGERPRRGRNRDVRCPQDCPAEIAALIARCAAMNPSDRPSAQEVMEVLLSSPAASQVEALDESPV